MLHDYYDEATEDVLEDLTWVTYLTNVTDVQCTNIKFEGNQKKIKSN